MRQIDSAILAKPLTSEEEIAAVDAAIAGAGGKGPVASHLATALGLLSDRKNPDYRNSIKESISAVEASCCHITSDKKASLGQALKKLEGEGVAIHEALKGAFEKLYGYTSNANGIRHALLAEPTLDFEDAKFMLVVCSAFVNLLRVRSGT
ncbi:MAG: hypothetical protein HY985_09055 [Magnetospirillum sp.]|nr:hypothetical protein [Magnetospirillum sp.]